MYDDITINGKDTGVQGGAWNLNGGGTGAGTGSGTSGLNANYTNSLNRLGAMAYQNPEEMAGRAAVDTEGQFGRAKSEQSRRMQEMGVNPNSGRFAGTMADENMSMAASKAGNMMRARKQAEMDNFTRLNDVTKAQQGAQGLSLEQQNNLSNQDWRNNQLNFQQQQYYDTRLDKGRAAQRFDQDGHAGGNMSGGTLGGLGSLADPTPSMQYPANQGAQSLGQFLSPSNQSMHDSAAASLNPVSDQQYYG
jgi:hypothetical protein